MKLRTAHVLVVVFVAFVLLANRVAAQSSTDNIDASVKISVCGDEFAEGPEDCDGTDLSDETCESIGYGPGDLSCDISCGFDTSLCSEPTPTPTPTSTTTPSSDNSSSSSSSSLSDDSTPIPSLPVSIPIEIVEEALSGLPIAVSGYDTDGSGRLEETELREIMEVWMRVVRNQEEGECDFNEDAACNVVDFSILLFYVER